MQLRACPSCRGLSPDGAPACVHCDAPVVSRRPLARLLFGLASGSAFAMTLMACYGMPPSKDTCFDRDDDGWFPGCYDEAAAQPCDPDDAYCDCDDGNPRIHPEAADPTGDGVDQDCDGVDGPRPGT